MEDWRVDGRVAVETTVDTITSMKGKGQYIYVTVKKEDSSGEPDPPIVKFNNGHEGGSQAVLFNDAYKKDPKGMFHALYKDKIDPAIRDKLPVESPAAAETK
mmetsp:Transcript_46548/g.81982  ORF Transcript_46548/g.81982 Transcript_46548/m.81982 type:complete len:102 (+) Transcript_46548:94-399(+)